MRTYELKAFFPSWHLEPATPRQLKVLSLFGVPCQTAPNKGPRFGNYWASVL